LPVKVQTNGDEQTLVHRRLRAGLSQADFVSLPVDEHGGSATVVTKAEGVLPMCRERIIFVRVQVGIPQEGLPDVDEIGRTADLPSGSVKLSAAGVDSPYSRANVTCRALRIRLACPAPQSSMACRP
jgi:hypothetical protein